MRAVLQRVSRARVTVEERVVAEVAAGLMILLGVGTADTLATATSMAEKIANLRIFEDDTGKMNRSLLDVKGNAVVISQFTLYGDARGQRRPSFVAAARPEQAKLLYEEFCSALTKFECSSAHRSFSGHHVSRIGQRGARNHLAGFRQNVLTSCRILARK